MIEILNDIQAKLGEQEKSLVRLRDEVEDLQKSVQVLEKDYRTRMKLVAKELLNHPDVKSVRPASVVIGQ